jgi:hypothetical protein
MDALSSLDGSLAVLDSISTELPRTNQPSPTSSGGSSQNDLTPNSNDARTNGLSRNFETRESGTGASAQRGAEPREQLAPPNGQSVKGKERAVEETPTNESAGQLNPAAERTKEKGKGRAATVEDDAENLD